MPASDSEEFEEKMDLTKPKSTVTSKRSIKHTTKHTANGAGTEAVKRKHDNPPPRIQHQGRGLDKVDDFEAIVLSSDDELSRLPSPPLEDPDTRQRVANDLVCSDSDLDFNFDAYARAPSTPPIYKAEFITEKDQGQSAAHGINATTEMKQDGVGVEGYQEKVASDDWGLDFEYDLAEPNPEHDVYIGIQQADDDFQDFEDDQGLVDRRGTQQYHQHQQHDHQSGGADEDNEELHQGEYLGGPEVFGGGDSGWGDDRGSDDEVIHRGQEAELSNIFGKRIISKADRR
jgi:hypothetical protein